MAGIPDEASKTLTKLGKANIPVISEYVKTLRKKFNKSEQNEAEKNYYVVEKIKIKIKKLTGNFVLYKPPKAENYLFAAIFEKVSLHDLGLDSGPIDQLGLHTTVVIFTPDKLGQTKIKLWPGQLGTALRGLAPPGRAVLRIEQGLNSFSRLADGASGETADLFREIGIKNLNDLTVELRRALESPTITATIMHWADWPDPFKLKGTTFSKVSILLEKGAGGKKSVQAWGDFRLPDDPDKTYFLWGGYKSTARAFGLGTDKISMDSLMVFVDAIQAVSGSRFRALDVVRKLPLEDITIKNKKYKSYEPGVFPNAKTFIVTYAQNETVTVADTKKKGPFLEAHGSADILKWATGKLDAYIYPDEGRYEVDAEVSSLHPLPMSSTKFTIRANESAGEPPHDGI